MKKVKRVKPAPPVLDYGTPPKPKENVVDGAISGIMGISAALLSFLTLFYGVTLLAYTFTESRSQDVLGNLFQAAISLLVFVLSLRSAFRLLRSARRQI